MLWSLVLDLVHCGRHSPPMSSLPVSSLPAVVAAADLRGGTRMTKMSCCPCYSRCRVHIRVPGIPASIGSVSFVLVTMRRPPVVLQALVERAQTTLHHVVGARAVQSVVTEREAIAFGIVGPGWVADDATALPSVCDIYSSVVRLMPRNSILRNQTHYFTSQYWPSATSSIPR